MQFISLTVSTGDTMDVGFPNKFTGLYSFNAAPGQYRIIYTGYGYFSQSIDTTILQDNPVLTINLDVSLQRDKSISRKVQRPFIYTKINLSDIPTVAVY